MFNMQRPVGSTVDKSVFGISVGTSLLFVLWEVLFMESLSAAIMSVAVMVLVALFFVSGASAPQQFRVERNLGER